jgi:hypothetical protein
MRILCMGLAVAALAIAAPAAAVTFDVTPGASPAVPTNNNFKTPLANLGLRFFTGAGASISLSGPATLTFEYLGSESGFHNKFTVTGTGGFSYQEFSGGTEAWNAAGAAFGWPVVYSGGPITNWQFSSPGRSNPGPYGLNTEQFGIFLPHNNGGVFSTSVLYLGYDDEPGRDDDNHDDMIIRVTAKAFVEPGGGAVPEPASWAMLIAGFGLVGAAQRRRKAVVAA